MAFGELPCLPAPVPWPDIWLVEWRKNPTLSGIALIHDGLQGLQRSPWYKDGRETADMPMAYLAGLKSREALFMQ